MPVEVTRRQPWRLMREVLRRHDDGEAGMPGHAMVAFRSSEFKEGTRFSDAFPEQAPASEIADAIPDEQLDAAYEAYSAKSDP